MAVTDVGRVDGRNSARQPIAAATHAFLAIDLNIDKANYTTGHDYQLR